MFMGKLACLAGGLWLAAGPALAATDVVFTGTVSDTCTLAVPTPGIMTLSGDGKTLGSDQTLGVPATVTVVSLGSNSVTLAAPTLTDAPSGYAGGETVQMSYSGLASHAYTSQQQSFALGILPLTNLIINMQVLNPNGFVQGTYKAKTVLTCS
ncbi:MAG: hypothetical protein BGO82_07070 [Devosia sp. 67-54]|nr:MAG: hypothetical protein BGO82_07070 [Devosia sp. 67-54]